MSSDKVNTQYLLEKLDRIDNQTARAAVIIDHMRMFGRKSEGAFENIDPRQIITNSLDLMGEQLKLAGIEVVTNLPDKCSQIVGNMIQLEQVILNLLINSRDAMSDKNIKQKITLSVFEDDLGVHIASQDTGGGFSKEILPRIFEPFYTTKAIGKGTGLGLSLSYGIISEMNGTIVADNVEDGARLIITLPAYNSGRDLPT